MENNIINTILVPGMQNLSYECQKSFLKFDQKLLKFCPKNMSEKSVKKSAQKSVKKSVQISIKKSFKNDQTWHAILIYSFGVKSMSIARLIKCPKCV